MKPSSAQTLVVGDIQGCYGGLMKLLDKCQFDEKRDQLYAVGDLVARGEDSLATLTFLKGLGSCFTSVLGNHDLHLLAVSRNIHGANKKDRLDNLLTSDRLEELCSWLQTLPLALAIDHKHIMVHAGLYPGWSPQQLLRFSDEVSQALQQDPHTFLAQMYGNAPASWQPDLPELERLRFIVNACTRMRFVDTDLKLDLQEKGTPPASDKNLLPWFSHPQLHLPDKQRIIFGHWAALEGKTPSKRIIGLDTGYVWGNTMTAYRIETKERIVVSP